jgi:DNA-binding MarR family transcriptional regulator/GNAT superfamily N-acetyltransferase
MQAIGQIRSFNRTITRQVGALEAHFLDTPRSLAACRLLFEIGPAGQDIVHLRASLGLDSGYLSRLLRGLEKEGLVQTNGSPRDSRVRRASLTREGRLELARLNRRSDAAARALLRPLQPFQRDTLVQAMATVERLIISAVVEIRVESPRSAAARYCLNSYFTEIASRFATGFDPQRSSTSAADFRPPRGYFLVAWLHGDPIGCVGLRCGPRYAEVKRMWVAPQTRGLGVGRRLLQRVEGLAIQRHLHTVRLETNKALVEAQSLYRKQGYREVPAYNAEPYAHFWFEKALPESRVRRP